MAHTKSFRRPLIAAACMILAAGVLGSAPAPAQDMEMSIVAIVNDEVISGFDLEQRVKLIVGSSGYEPTPEELTRLRAQVLRSLIDEKLKFQEAKRLEVEVEDQDVVEQLEYIASRNNMTVQDIQKQLKDEGISIFTLTDQIKVDIAWNMLVRGRYGNQVKVNPDEVQRILDEARVNVDKPQYEVAEIYLPVDSPDDEEPMRQLAKDIIEKVKGGVPFGDLAQQYSQSSSAANGGEIGWVLPGQLPQELDQWLAGARANFFTVEPIQTVSGFYLLAVIDTRNVARRFSSGDTPLFVQRIVVPLGANESVERAQSLARRMDEAAAQVSGCNTLEQVAATLPGARIVDVGTTTFNQLADRDKVRMQNLVSGRAAGPVDRTDQGLDILVLCGHAEEQEQGLPSAEDVEARLVDQQLSILSRRYLRDLRRDAVIDTRIAEAERDE